MSKLIDRVENLLIHGYKTASPQKLRDNNKALVLAYWELDGLFLTDEQKRIFMKTKSASAITRERRNYNERYPASKNIQDMRFERYKEYKYDKVMYI